jgi:hypothetical protein
LKAKNRIAGELDKLWGRLSQSNSWEDENTPPYDAEKVLEEIKEKQEELIELKAKIAVANAAHMDKIIRMAELRSMMSQLGRVSVKEGTERRTNWRTDAEETVTYHSTIGRVKMDELLDEVQSELNQLQDELDAINFSTEV